MYKLFKEKGYSDITLKNMDTYGEISLGRYTATIEHLLNMDGYEIDNPGITGDKSIKAMDKWNLDISDDIARDLNNLARRGTKAPVRHQISKTKQQSERQEIRAGARIDLFDLIFSDDED